MDEIDYYDVNKRIHIILDKEYLNIKKYFNQSYPDRSRSNGFGFRINEVQRIVMLKRLISSLDFESILDIGCGDGNLLNQILLNNISYIRLEDIVEKNINTAKISLRNKADRIDAEVVNSIQSESNGQYDLVLSIGMLDYYHDWNEIIKVFHGKAKSILVIDFPKAKTVHSLLRKTWLKRFNIKLRTISKQKLINLLNSLNLNYEIYNTSFNWLVVIRQQG